MYFLILLAELSDTDRDFVMEIYQEYKGYMYKVSMDVLKNTQDAEDAVNDIMCKIIQHLSKFKDADDENIRNQIVLYMRTIIRNKVFDKYGKNKRYREKVTSFYYKSDETDEYHMIDIEDENMNLEDIVINKETRDIVRREISNLSPELQDAINLVYMCDYSITETAEFLNINEGAVRARLFRARNKLRETLYKEGVGNVNE